uniref:Uncharacterized protein n=1 Tax=Setaria italica TaxID=4555 RepID=K4AHQ6_SETIT
MCCLIVVAAVDNHPCMWPPPAVGRRRCLAKLTKFQKIYKPATTPAAAERCFVSEKDWEMKLNGISI